MTTINTYRVTGNEVTPATVTCEIRDGIGLFLDGMNNDASVKECLLRVCTSLLALHCNIPGKRVVISVSPENKGSGEDSLLDVPVALAILRETGQRNIENGIFAVGELSLDGYFRGNGAALEKIISVHRSLHPDEPITVPDNGDETETDNVVRAKRI